MQLQASAAWIGGLVTCRYPREREKAKERERMPTPCRFVGLLLASCKSTALDYVSEVQVQSSRCGVGARLASMLRIRSDRHSFRAAQPIGCLQMNLVV
jgi:hypothetical protein